jgi:hypothetical protein
LCRGREGRGRGWEGGRGRWREGRREGPVLLPAVAFFLLLLLLLVVVVVVVVVAMVATLSPFF